MLRHLTLASLGLAPCLPVHAQCTEWQPDLGPSGTSGLVERATVFDDGSGPALYVAGTFGAAGDAAAIDVARWDGTSWSGVGEGLWPDEDQRVTSLGGIDLGSGPWLYATCRSIDVFDQPKPALRYWDGLRWRTFAGGPPPLGARWPGLMAAAVFDSGAGPELYVGGVVRSTGYNTATYLARWDGASWEVLDGPAVPECGDTPCDDGAITGLAVFDDGSGPALYACGAFTEVDGTPGVLLARFDGTSWSTVPGTGPGGFQGDAVQMVVHDDGGGERLFLLRSYVSAPGDRLIAFDGAGFETVGNLPPHWIERMSSLPAASGHGPGLWVHDFRRDPSTGRLASSRWDGAQWHTLQIEMAYPAEIELLEAFDAGAGAELVIGGQFPRPIEGVASANVARWDGAAWQAMGPTGHGLHSQFGDPGDVTAFARHDDGSGPALYAAGEIAWSAGEPLATLARWEDGRWEPIPGFNLPYLHSVADVLSTDADGTPVLWIAGDLKVGISNPDGLASWDGVELQGYLPGGQGLALVEYDAGSGEEVYVLGGGGAGGGISRGGLSGFTFVTSVPPWTRTMTVHDDGSGPQIYLGGSFTSVGGVPARNVVRWDGSTWTPVGEGLGSSTEETVEVLLSHDDGSGSKLYAGGWFESSGGTALRSVACWDGASWSDVGGGVDGEDPIVYALELFDDGRGDGAVLYAGGRFESAGGEPAHGLARFDGASWDGEGLAIGGLVPEVRELMAVDLLELGGGALAVGGDFESIDGLASQHVAVLRRCGTGELFCLGDGSAGPCPCGNESAPDEAAGCLNSQSLAGTLRAQGTASLSDDTLVLFGGGMPDQPVLYFQAATTHPAVPFGDGLKCTGGPFVRLATRVNSNGASSYPGAGDEPISMRGMIGGPTTLHYQARYRDPAAFCTSDSFNYTNALTIEWVP